MKILLRVLVSIGLLTALLLLLPWSEVSAAFLRMSLPIWLGVLAVYLVGHRFGVLKWRALLNAGRSGLSRIDAYRCYAAGLFANLCLPSIVGGDLLRATLAARKTRRTEAAVLGGLADRFVDLAALLLLLVVGGLAAGRALPQTEVRVLAVALLVAAIVTLVAFVIVAKRPLSRWPRRVRRRISRGLVAIRRLRRFPETAWLAFGISIAMQGSYVLLNAWIGHSVGVRVPLAAWFVAWPLAKLAGLIPISLNGLGVRDAAQGALLVPLGVPLAVGVVASLIWQTVLIAGGLLAGALWYALSRRARSASADRGTAAATPRSEPGGV